MSHAISGDGVHANHHQRKCPTLPTPEIKQRVKSGHEDHAPTTAKKYPTWSPDAFHDWTSSQPAQCHARSQSCDAGGCQPFHFGPWRTFVADHTTSQQTKNHRAQCWNETQRAVAALVMGERMFAWKKIQKPCVERPREIRVLVPMCRKTSELICPIR